MWTCLKIDFYNIFYSQWFLLGVIGVTVLLLSAPGYTNPYGKSYSIASLLLAFQEGAIIETNQISIINLLAEGMGGVFRVFSMLCTGISFAVTLASERTSGYIRFLNYYAGTKTYVWSKAISGLISGGMIGVIGFLAFFLFIVTSIKVQGIYYISVITFSLLAKVLVGYVLGIFFYGAVSTGWIFLFAAWVKNKYLLICLPFLANYLYLQLLFKWKVRLIEDGKIDSLNRVAMIEPTVLIYTFTTSTPKVALVIHGLFLITSIAIFYYGMKRRRDLGE